MTPELETPTHAEFQVAEKTFGVELAQALIVEKAGAPFRLMVIPLKQAGPQELNLLYVYLGAGDAVTRVAVFHTRTDAAGMEIRRQGDQRGSVT